MHSLQMNALLPIIRLGTPGARCGVPVMIFATSPLDRPQKEQLNPRAFIFAIIGSSFANGRALLSVRDNLVYYTIFFGLGGRHNFVTLDVALDGFEILTSVLG